jgi:hypothetical protein
MNSKEEAQEELESVVDTEHNFIIANFICSRVNYKNLNE